MTEPSVLDRVTTVLLMAGLAFLVLVGTVFGGLTGMSSDGCTASTCNYPLLNTGVRISMISPGVVGLGAVFVVVRRWVREQRTWWVPLAAAVVMVVAWVAGASLTEFATR